MRRDNVDWNMVIDAVFDGRGELDPMMLEDVRVIQYRKVAQAFKAGTFEPSVAVVQKAKALVAPAARRRLPLFLAPGSALASGARLSQGSEAQFLLEGEDVRIRLMLERTTDGWIVTGQASNGPWLVEGATAEAVSDESGRFVLTLLGESSALILRKSDVEFSVPTYEELANLGPLDQ